MKFQINQDYHIHSVLSKCSGDPLQTPEAILAHAKQHGLAEICLSNHFWDSGVPGANGFYQGQDLSHIKKELPLPQDPAVKFYFGCEAEMDKDLTVGGCKETWDAFDFINFPLTHLHQSGFTVSPECDTVAKRADCLVRRFHGVMEADLPFHKMGFAHLTTHLIAPLWDDHLSVLDAIPHREWEDFFGECAKRGTGIELNIFFTRYKPEEYDRLFRPYRIAKEAGCRFYLGSDAHHPDRLEASLADFKGVTDFLGLTEQDHFYISNISKNP